MKKERLDKYLTDLGYFETKSKAAAAILAGTVKVNDEVITKAGYQVDTSKEYNFSVKTMSLPPPITRNLEPLFRYSDITFCISSMLLHVM